MNFLLPIYTLWRRELVRFYRQPSRVLGALGSPLIFWLLIGSGIGTSFQSGHGAAGDAGFLHFFFPGTLLLILLFTAIFSTISLIEDRKEGFLQAVLVAPVSRAGIVLGKILGGATLAFLQGTLFLLISPWVGVHLDWMGWVWVGVALFINAFALTSLGFFIAWQFRSIQGFHAVMNLFLIPLWILSGALFPSEGAMGWVKGIMVFNPLTYGAASLRATLFPLEKSLTFYDLMIPCAFGIFLLFISNWMASRTTSRDY